jgi:hypothetical protein
MADPDALEKTNRINLLFDFYEPLLTEKQRTFLKQYFHENYSLGEIAAAFNISRQAVYEHIKRAEAMLNDFEDKLKLLAKHEERQREAGRIEALLAGLDPEIAQEIGRRVRHLANID